MLQQCFLTKLAAGRILNQEGKEETMFKVMNGKRFTGIIESNYAWAFSYWTKRGFTLVRA